MIVFELICPDNHRFEGWFASAGDFESQKGRGLLVCPNCGNPGVAKLLTAKIGKGDAAPQSTAVVMHAPAPAAQVQVSLNDVINLVLQHTEDVGAKFAAEARRIHNDEAPSRAIRGTASREETEELLEEGVPILPLPIPPQGDWH